MAPGVVLLPYENVFWPFVRGGGTQYTLEVPSQETIQEVDDRSKDIFMGLDIEAHKNLESPETLSDLSKRRLGTSGNARKSGFPQGWPNLSGVVKPALGTLSEESLFLPFGAPIRWCEEEQGL